MCDVLPVDPLSIHQETNASDGALDHPRRCSVLIWFAYPSCSELAQKVAKAVMKQADFPSLVRFETLSWTLGRILIIVGHPTDGNPVLRLLTLVFVASSCMLRIEPEI